MDRKYSNMKLSELPSKEWSNVVAMLSLIWEGMGLRQRWAEHFKHSKKSQSWEEYGKRRPSRCRKGNSTTEKIWGLLSPAFLVV